MCLGGLPFLLYTCPMQSMATTFEPRLWVSRKKLIPRLLLGVATIMFVVGLKWFAQPPQDNDDEGCKRPEMTGVARALSSNDMYDPCVINPTTGIEYRVISPGGSSSGWIRL